MSTPVSRTESDLEVCSGHHDPSGQPLYEMSSPIQRGLQEELGLVPEELYPPDWSPKLERRAIWILGAPAIVTIAGMIGGGVGGSMAKKPVRLWSGVPIRPF